LIYYFATSIHKLYNIADNDELKSQKLVRFRN